MGEYMKNGNFEVQILDEIGFKFTDFFKTFSEAYERFSFLVDESEEDGFSGEITLLEDGKMLQKYEFE